MKKITLLLLAVCWSASFCSAQFSASGDTNGAPYDEPRIANSGLEKIYVFKDVSNAELSFNDSNPLNWKWFRYEQNPTASVAVSASDVHTTSSSTVLDNVQAGYGYYVQSNDGSVRHYCFVVAYLPASFSDITFTTKGDVNTTLTLEPNALVSNMFYYTIAGNKKPLTRVFTLTWESQEWNSETKKYASKAHTSEVTDVWVIPAPLSDTNFFITGDQYAKWFGETLPITSKLYHAIAVQTNAIAVPQGREGSNELNKVNVLEYPKWASISGPAPLVIDFYSYPSEAVAFYIWTIYNSEDGTGAPLRDVRDENMNHTFLESGKYLVKLRVYNINSTCTDSTTFLAVISESLLDCPNFFTPRSTPGENDEFRVAYRSIVKFKGTIINRWGNVLFEWTDPSKGWNGTFKGKAVSPGVYFYLIEAKGSDGIVYKKKGDINLLE